MNEKEFDLVSGLAQRLGLTFNQAADWYMMYGTRTSVIARANATMPVEDRRGIASAYQKSALLVEEERGVSERTAWNAKVDARKAARKRKRK